MVNISNSIIFILILVPGSPAVKKWIVAHMLASFENRLCNKYLSCIDMFSITYMCICFIFECSSFNPQLCH